MNLANLQNCLGIRFLLQHGHMVEAVLISHEAKNLLSEWMTGALQLKDRKRIGGEDKIGRIWSVEVSQIIGIVVDKIQVQNSIPNPTAVPELFTQPHATWSGQGKPPWLQ